jgi:large subunit ribosomal protein L31e
MTKDKDKKKEPKLVLEREYIVPLRSGWQKVAEYKRANRAIKEIKKFMVRHMKIYDRDLRKIKIDNYLNNEIRFRGMRKPPAKIKVIAKKYDDDTVRVELVNLPKHVEFAKKRNEKISSDIKKKVEEKKPEEKANSVSKETENSKNAEKDEKKEEEAREKEAASKDESLKIAKEQAKEQKHSVQPKVPTTQNMGNKRASRTK